MRITITIDRASTEVIGNSTIAGLDQNSFESSVTQRLALALDTVEQRDIDVNISDSYTVTDSGSLVFTNTECAYERNTAEDSGTVTSSDTS